MPEAIRKERATVKRLPLPGVLSARIVPPMSSTNRRLIASPRPLPPKRRAVEASAWLNAVNNRDKSSSVMPMPVSCTEISNSACAAVRRMTLAAIRTLPAAVNLTALPTRLPITWVMRCGSPMRTAGSSRSMVVLIPIFFSAAWDSKISTTLPITPFSEKGTISRFSFPASTFEKSRISLRTARSDSPLVLIFSA